MTGAGCAFIPAYYLIVRARGAWETGVSSTVIRDQMVPWTMASIVLVVAVVATCLVVGSLIGWLVAGTDLPARHLLLVVSVLPLAVPSYVAAYGWLQLIPGIQGFWPTWAVLSAACMPYVVLPVAAALRGADQTLVEIALASGRSPLHAWIAGLGPQIAPAAAAGALLAGLYALSDFGTPSLLRHQVLTFAVQRQYSSLLGRERAALLAIALVVLALALVLAERMARGNAERWRRASGAPRVPRPVRLGRLALPAYALVLLPAIVGAAAPVYALFRRLALGTRRTLDWNELLDATWATLLAAALGGLVAMALAACVGVLAARYPSRLTSSIETVAFSAHALPGIVVGLAMVYVSLRVVPGLYQTLPVLLFAYGVLFLPKAVGAVRTSVAAVPPALGEAAAAAGRPPLLASLVTARVAAPGLLTGLLLVVVTIMKELPATMILRPTGFDTLAFEIWSRAHGSAQGAAAPYALTLVLVASIPSFLLTWHSLPRRRREPTEKESVR